MVKKILPVVHLVDTEGPLNETIDETFRKLKQQYKIDLKPTQENLDKVQRGEGIPIHLKEEVMRRYSKHRLSYNRNWSDVDAMCKKLFTKEFRSAYSDSLGNPYCINWHCIDLLGFEENPRERELKPNVVYQFYEKWIRVSGTVQDQLFWHYHPIAFSRAAHHSGTSLNHFPLHYRSLCHRVLDCHHFPSVFRPGYHMERTDLNLFLEQWIPFDYANQNVEGRQQSSNYGRIQNWDGAPTDWSVYHPSFHDPRKSGNLKRTIARTLNIGTDFSLLTEIEVEKAFEAILAGKPAILSYADHDSRDMTVEVEEAHALITKVHQKYKDQVDFKFCNGVEAMRMALHLPKKNPIQIQIELKENRLNVELDRTFFGSQPFLAIRDQKGNLYHDNFCLTDDPLRYFYVFDDDSIKLDEVLEVGVAVNDDSGNTSVANYHFLDKREQKFQYSY
jgi:hypothetical protein